MEFVAFIGKDKENWGQVKGLLNRSGGESFVIVKDKEVNEFPIPVGVETINVDCTKPILELKSDMINFLKPKLSGDFEVSLSIASGNGKEHMALISALLSIPVGIKLVVFTKNGVEHIN
jgi:hypothetical protein